MSRVASARVGVAVLLILGVAIGLGASAAEPDGGVGRAAAKPQLLSLPKLASAAPAAEWPFADETLQLLQRDTNIACGYARAWKAGDQLGVVLQASGLQYPLALQSVTCYLYNFLPYSQTVSLRAHVYSWLDGHPAMLLGSSTPQTFSLALSSTLWVRLSFSETVSLASPQPFLVAVQYVDGAEGQTPSVVSDLSTEISEGLCYYQTTPGVWREHYAFWPEASEVGFSMIRAWVVTSGGPGDETITEPEADAFLAERFPRSAFGAQEYLLVGDDPLSGDARALLRFPLPLAPVAGATPIAAMLRLFRYGEVTSTLSLTVTAYRVTSSWDERSATWHTHSASYAEVYGSGRVPAQRPYPTPARNYLLHLDVGELVQKWYQGTPNEGLMLIGGEGTPGSAKRFYARELAAGSERRPRLIIKWALPAPTETPSAIPTSQATLTATFTLTATPSAQGPTLSPTVTATSETLTPTATPVLTKALYLPLIHKGGAEITIFRRR